MYIEENRRTHISLLSNDMLGILSEMKVTEINNSYVKSLIDNGNITHINNTLIEQLGEFWATNQTELATKFIANITEGLLVKVIMMLN